jgi:hypothetical protein
MAIFLPLIVDNFSDLVKMNIKFITIIKPVIITISGLKPFKVKR